MPDDRSDRRTADISGESQGLAADLRQIQNSANGMPIKIAVLLEKLTTRGNAVAILLLAAPFVVIPIPGLSTAMGVVLFGLSLSVLLGAKPLVPGFVKRREVSARSLDRLASGTDSVLRKVQRFVRPRMEWVVSRRLDWLSGLSLLAGTVLFALPLPIPGNNIPPAIGLVMISLGMIERDGLLVLIGHIYTLILWLILIACAILFWTTLKAHVLSKFHGDGQGATQPIAAMPF